MANQYQAKTQTVSNYGYDQGGTLTNQFNAQGNNAGTAGANAWNASNTAKAGIEQGAPAPMSNTQFSNLYQAPATTGGPTGAGFENTPGYQGMAAWGGQQFGNEQAQTQAAVNPAALGLSADYLHNYNMTPQEIQGLATQAGRTVGNQFQTMQDQAARGGAAAGMSQEGIQAEQERAATAGAAQAGSTMADARLSAQLAALGVTQNRESTRLGAEQAKAGTLLTQAGQGIQEVGQATNTGMGVLGAESGLAVTAAQMGQQGQQAQFGQGMASSNQISNQAATLSSQLQSGAISQEQYQTQMGQLMANVYGTTGNLQLGANAQNFAMRSTPVWQQILSGVEGATGSAAGVMTGVGNMNRA